MFVGDPIVVETGNINVLATYLKTLIYLLIFSFRFGTLYLMVLHGLSSIAQLLAIVLSHCSHIQQLQCLYGNLFF